MAQATVITPALLKAIRADADAALAAVAQKHGVVLRCGNGSYAETTAHLKLEIALGAAEGERPSHVKAREDWNKGAVLFGLQKEWLGKDMPRRGKPAVTIIGLMPKRQRFPVLVREEGGKEVLLTIEEVCHNMTTGVARARAAV